MSNLAESIASRHTVMSSIKESLAEVQRSAPAITITINGDADGKSHKFYTNKDRIDGDIKIVAPSDTRFDEISITFEGTSRTWMERFGGSPATSGRTTVSQTFLRLVQPIEEDLLPIPRIATKGQTYTFPFTFVIPERLLPSACAHLMGTENPSVDEAHLSLPPSLGDSTLFALNDKDDLAPDMTRISYGIRVRVIRKRDSDDKTMVLADTLLKVAISPSVLDAPPTHIDEKSKDYVLRKEKDLRKGLLGKKMGRISVFAEQPQPLRLMPNSPCPSSTRVPVSLTFVPANNETSPPELGSMAAKLRTTTFFATSRVSYIPTVSRSNPDPFVGMYREATSLSSRCLSNVSWEKQTSDGANKPTYKAQVVVPIASPKCKHLVPTFSTCFVSRSYSLDLALSVRTSNHSQPALTLRLPLQVSQPTKNALEFESMPDTGVDEFFVPRIISPSSLQHEAAIMPPPAFEGREKQAHQVPATVLPSNQMPPPDCTLFWGTDGPPVVIPPPMGMPPGCG